MGIYLNPNNENFARTLKRPIYVDKTQMISVINYFMETDNTYLCVSRPRRFGKTIAGNMLSAYFSKGCDSRSLFAPYKISSDPSFESNLNKLNVIKVDVNSEYRNELEKEKLLDHLTDKVLSEMKAEFPSVTFTGNISIAQAILNVYAALGERFIIILDEYDVLVRENVPQKLFTQYLDFLNGLFKSNTLRPAIALAYITGILPVIRDKVQSKLNNFREYTILDAGKLAEYIGFTDEEVRDLCKNHALDYEECRRWYDGYKQHGLEIYNPESVVLSIENQSFESYWSRTSTYAVISDRIQQNFDGMKDDVIRMLAGESIDVNVTRYMNTMTDFSARSDAFTYLIHLGYLAYDRETKTCRIPNKEVQQEWFNAIETNSDYAVTNKIIQASKELLAETLCMNEQAVELSLDESHIHVTSNRNYNNEDALQSAIYLSYIYALNKYTVIKEKSSYMASFGNTETRVFGSLNRNTFADVVFIPFVPNVPAIIIELKRNKSPDTALSQIKEKKYFDSLNHYSGDLLFVGVNYDADTKKHECKIERFVKN